MISLIIGLGNIGRKYEHTRHNLGFDLISQIAQKWGIRPEPGKGDFYFASKERHGRPIHLIWPTTYMNNSGLAVTQALELYSLSVNDLLIAYDDFNIPLGRIRIRPEGSDGGHNGMASIVEHLGSDKILRLRMGIGPVPPETDPIIWVLNRFDQKEIEIKDKMLDKAGEALLYLLDNSAEKAMSFYNPAPEEA